MDLLLPPKYVGAEQGGIDRQQVAELLPAEHRAFVDDLLLRYGVAQPPNRNAGRPGEVSTSRQGLRAAPGCSFRPRHPVDRQRAGTAAG
ncbi:hypothetical protein BZL30_8263 [Mycobacterium kansasii]|uniref:Uncharacterized protein n=1 Tax=Mycobacterium kansasii TaxID=1768 RepID=A0A1V3WHV0_MYCKA|nr:hypothetical protein BZL30_8263 [Mycobacterium kansasii]